MTVDSTSDRAVAAQKMVLELLVSYAGTASAEHTHDSELLFWADKWKAPRGRLPGRTAVAADASHPAFEVNLDA